MKKFLLLMIALLAGVSGAWADVTVSHNPTTNGDFSSTSANLTGYYTTWTSNSTSGIAGLTIVTGGNLAMHQENIGNYGGNLLALKTTTTDGSQEVVTITAPTGFLIKGYTLKAQLQSSAKDAYRVYMTTGGYYSLQGSGNVTKNISESFSTPSSSITLKVVDLLVNSASSTNALCFTELTVDLILPVTVNDTNGSFTRSDGGTSDWKDTWTANSTISEAAGMTITTSTIPNNNNRFDMYYKSNTFKIATGYNGFTTQYTISAPSGYIIDSYTMTGTIASQAGAGVSCRPNESTTWTYIGKSATTVSVSNLGSSKAVFTLCGDNTAISLSSFVINLVPIHSKEATSALTNQIARATTIIAVLGTLPGTYSIDGDLAAQISSAQAVLDAGSSTAVEKATASTTLYNVIKTMTPNYPTTGFYRIYAPNQNVYVKSAAAAADAINTTAGTDNTTSIFYLENMNINEHQYMMLSYANGQYLVGLQQGAMGDYGIYRLMLGAAQEKFAVYGQDVSRPSGTTYSNPTGKLWYIHQNTTLGYSSNYPSNANYNVMFEPITALPVTLNDYGFSTFASPTAVDFSSASGYTAWQITAIDADNKITFAQVTGAVAAGTGLLLMGNNNAAIEVATAESGTDISGTNKLTGFTQATAIPANTYYGLSGNSFVKVSAGNLRGFKALLDKTYVNESAGAKAFTFVFEGADGITETRTVSREEAKAIFDLGGRQMAQPRKGINIINGKKVIVK